MRTPVILTVLSLIVLIAGLSAKSVILQDAGSISLNEAPALTGQISQRLVNSSSADTIPQVGTDYTLANTTYFDNNNWVVTAIKGKDGTVTDGLAVLQKKDGLFQLALGPGTSFSNTIVVNLPSDVSQYLYRLGVVDGSN